MFLQFVALFFLFLFILKALSPNVFPLIGKFFNSILNYIVLGFKILIKGFLYSITLLLTRTVYVVGLVILITLLISITLTTIKYQNILDFSTWFGYFKASILDIYVRTFFYGTYIIGIIHYIKDKESMTTKFIKYFDVQFRRKNSKEYVYDEQTKKYIYK